MPPPKKTGGAKAGGSPAGSFHKAHRHKYRFYCYSECQRQNKNNTECTSLNALAIKPGLQSALPSRPVRIAHFIVDR